MLKRFTTQELVFISLMSAALFVISFILASGIVAATGIPLSSAFITGIVVAIFVLITIKTVPKFGSLTLLLLIYSILEIPTSLGGAPGFWPKVPINVISGLLGDLFLFWTNYRRWSLYVGFYVIATLNIIAFVFFLWLLGLPGVDKTVAIIHFLILAYIILGTIGIFVGEKIWNKIKDKRAIRQIRG